jgi:hypothetical protein
VTIDELAAGLRDAADAHHEFEEHALGGEHDEQWPGFYAAFVLGRLGPFTTPSRLAALLAEVEVEVEVEPSDDWAPAAAKHVLAAVTP